MSLSNQRNQIPQGYELGQVNKFTPQQMQLFNQMFGNVGEGSFNQRLASGDQSIFNELEQPAKRQFSQLQGNIANRFSGQGLGGQSSSGFQQAQTSAAQDFASQLQSQRLGLQQQAQNDLFNMSQQLLGMSPYEQFLIKQQYEEEGPNFLQRLLGGIAPVAGGVIGGLATAGNPMGIAAGAGIGSSFGQAFQ